MRRITQFYDMALAPVELGVGQFSMLAEIQRCGVRPPAMGDLARVMVMDRSTLGHNLRPLERDGLIELIPDESDGRSRRVRLTPAGAERFQQASRLWQAAQRRFETAFGKERAGELRETLHELAGLELATGP